MLFVVLENVVLSNIPVYNSKMWKCFSENPSTQLTVLLQYDVFLSKIKYLKRKIRTQLEFIHQQLNGSLKAVFFSTGLRLF